MSLCTCSNTSFVIFIWKDSYRILRRTTSCLRKTDFSLVVFRITTTTVTSHRMYSDWNFHSLTETLLQVVRILCSTTMFAKYGQCVLIIGLGSLHFIVVFVVGLWLLSHPQPPLSGTGALWVTGTHQCDDPVRCCLCSCSCSMDVIVKVIVVVISNHTSSTEHTCRGIRRLEYHIVSTPSVCVRVTASTLTSTFTISWSRTPNHFQATLTQSLRAQCLVRGTELSFPNGRHMSVQQDHSFAVYTNKKLLVKSFHVWTL